MGDVSSVNPNPLPLVFEQKRGRVKPPRHLADLTAEERTAVAEALGEPAFRVKQVANHYYSRLERDPANMTDLPATSRDRIVAELLPTLLNPIRTMEADKGATVKSLWKLFDGALVESVLMRYTDRATICGRTAIGGGCTSTSSR